MKALTFVLFPLLLFLSCEDNTAMLRIQNTSTFNYENLVVRDWNIGSLPAGETTDYKAFDGIYSYGYISLFINGKNFVLQPIDFVGEKQYTKGQFKYNINVSDTSGTSVELFFVEE